MDTNNAKRNIFAGVVVVLLVALVVLDVVILVRLPKTASSAMAGATGTFAGPAGGPPGTAASSAALTPAQVDAINGATDEGNAPDSTAVTGMNLTLAPGLGGDTATKDITTATAWLKQNNFTIQNSGSDSILFSGTAGDVKTAFNVQMHKYTLDGTTCYGGVPAGDLALTVPSSLASFVTAISLPPSACTPKP